ncbi:5'-nucleotidase sure [Phtheirospermum japonicum]|uniref:5'-nucleotidase sure n=1 Tax=Phtheirospermum japonicum TaxID=374723 RepID=A0A830BEW3_9LAMI|nr:5'-nucleotidase sure [Phtheirospermum japonicum]
MGVAVFQLSIYCYCLSRSQSHRAAALGEDVVKPPAATPLSLSHSLETKSQTPFLNRLPHLSPSSQNNFLPPGLVSNLQPVLASRKTAARRENGTVSAEIVKRDDDLGRPSSSGNDYDNGLNKPIILVTNSDGIESPGLSHLVNALVISGINKGSSCGHHMFYSGVVAGAREALLNGAPSISVSLNWKKDVTSESDFKDAVTVCLPLINAAIRDIDKGIFPKGLSLNVEIPTSPLANKGLKLTKHSHWRSMLSWQAVSGTRNHVASRFTTGQPGLRMQFAQLGRDASAAGAARRLTTQKKNIEIVESVGVAGKADFKRTVKYFRVEMLEKDQEVDNEDLDFRALENGFVAVSLLPLYMHLDSETETAALNWISSAVQFG